MEGRRSGRDVRSLQDRKESVQVDDESMNMLVSGLSSPLDVRMVQVRRPAPAQSMRKSPRAAVGSPVTKHRDAPAPDDDSGASDSADTPPSVRFAPTLPSVDSLPRGGDASPPGSQPGSQPGSRKGSPRRDPPMLGESPDLGGSNVSLLDFLRRAAPECDGCALNLQCAVCDKKACMRCSLTHRRRDDSPQSLAPLFCVCCAQCDPDEQVYRLVCSLCKTAPLDKARKCTSCGRQTCESCTRGKGGDLLCTSCMAINKTRKSVLLLLGRRKESSDKLDKANRVGSPPPERSGPIVPSISAGPGEKSPRKNRSTSGILGLKSSGHKSSNALVESGDRKPTQPLRAARSSSNLRARGAVKGTAKDGSDADAVTSDGEGDGDVAAAEGVVVDPFPGVKLHMPGNVLPGSIAQKRTPRTSVQSMQALKHTNSSGNITERAAAPTHSPAPPPAHARSQTTLVVSPRTTGSDEQSPSPRAVPASPLARSSNALSASGDVLSRSSNALTSSQTRLAPVAAAPPKADAAAVAAAPFVAQSGLVLFDFVADAARNQVDLVRGETVVTSEPRQPWRPSPGEQLDAEAWAHGVCNGKEGWFPRLNCSWEEAVLDAWRSAAWKATVSPELPAKRAHAAKPIDADATAGDAKGVAFASEPQKSPSNAAAPKFKSGEQVRGLRDGKYVGCEVLHEGSAARPYRVKWCDDTVGTVFEADLRAPMRRTTSVPHLKHAALVKAAPTLPPAPTPGGMPTSAAVSGALTARSSTGGPRAVSPQSRSPTGAGSPPTRSPPGGTSPETRSSGAAHAEAAAVASTIVRQQTRAPPAPVRVGSASSPAAERPPVPAYLAPLAPGSPAPVAPLNIVPRPAEPPPPAPAVDTEPTLPFRARPTASVIKQRPKHKAANPSRAAGESAAAASLVPSLVEACATGDITRVRQLLRQGASPDVADLVSGHTALIAACINAHNPVVSLLVNEANCDLNAVDRSGHSVLHVLAEGGNDAAALWMVRRGASLKIRDNRGRTPADVSASFAAALAAAPPNALGESTEHADQLRDSGGGGLRYSAPKGPRALTASGKDARVALGASSLSSSNK